MMTQQSAQPFDTASTGAHGGSARLEAPRAAQSVRSLLHAWRMAWCGSRLVPELREKIDVTELHPLFGTMASFFARHGSEPMSLNQPLHKGSTSGHCNGILQSLLAPAGLEYRV